MPIVSAARLDEKMSWASSLTSAPATPGRPGTENRWRREAREKARNAALQPRSQNTRRPVTAVGRVVRRSGRIDAASRGMDGSVVEAAVALMRRQFEVAGKAQGR